MAVTFRETRRVSTTGRCCAKSGMLLARLLGRSTCLLSGPWGLALCGGPLGSRQTFPVERQFPCRRLCVVKVTAVSKYLGYQADNRQQVDESPGERVGSLLPSGGKLTPRGRRTRSSHLYSGE